MVDEGPLYDGQMKLDQNGYDAIVVGTEAQGAAIERIPGTTFLPYSAAAATQLHKLNMRNMLPNPAFHNAIQNISTEIPHRRRHHCGC